MKHGRTISRRTFFDLPPLELECMKALWAQGQAGVKEIRAQINGSNGRALAYTTIETIMDRLTRKGAVVRRKVGRAHLYTPQYQAAAARADAVGALVHHFFAGSRRALVSYLAGQPLPEPSAARLGSAGLQPLRESGFSKRGEAERRPRAKPRGAPEVKAGPAKPQPVRPFDPSLL